jgi:hypothetical protein
MPEDKYCNANKHQGGIENVQKHLVTQNISTSPLGVLYHPHHASDHNKQTRGIQYVQRLLPIQMRGERGWCRVPMDSGVEEIRHYDEEPEEDDLDEKAD